MYNLLHNNQKILLAYYTQCHTSKIPCNVPLHKSLYSLNTPVTPFHSINICLRDFITFLSCRRHDPRILAIVIIIRLFVVLLASPYLELILCHRRKLLHSVACPCGLAYLFPFAFYVLINAVICTAYLLPRKLNAVSANTAYL